MNAGQLRRTAALAIAIVLAAPARLAGGTQVGHALTASTLSVLENAGAQCHWYRWDPVTGRKLQVATFDLNCDSPSLAWSYDGQQALVMLSQRPQDAESPWVSWLWLVDLDKRTQRRLKPPPLGAVDRIGFDRHGVAHALTLQDSREEAEAPGPTAPLVHFLRWKDQKIVRPAGFKGAGEPCLAHDFALTSADAWDHADVRYTLTGARLSPRTFVLPVSKELGPTSWDVDFALFPWREVDDPTWKTKLEMVQPSTDESRWMRLGEIQPPVFGLVDESVMPANIGAVVMLDGQKVIVVSADKHGTVYARVPYVLIDRETTQLYDLGARKVVWSKAGLSQTIFWPSAAPRK